MENQKTALENIDAAIDSTASILATRKSSDDLIAYGQAMETLYRLRVEELARVKRMPLA